ncbi:hypothetical protein KPL71_017878 [Citrus sinensis]|uniref:Uncharacterized protein n=1 Tax=Citrus sinensis TaxID=2711 RepID=A0ACB8JTI9_CITSI|nr:hypothetical protein KPL71_017878 [Citrus sinensis]
MEKRCVSREIYCACVVVAMCVSHAFRGIYRDRAKDAKFTFLKIHVYGFSKARDPEFDFHECIRIALAEVAEVHLVVPGKWMLCALFVLPESVPLQEDHPICK